MPFRHVLLAVLITAIWGFSFVTIEIGLKDFPPILFCALRFVLASLPFIFFIGPRDAPWKPIILVGLLLGTIQFSLVYIAILMGVRAGMTSLLIQSQVFFTVIFSALLLKEIPSLRDWSGMFLAFTGIGLIATTMQEASALAGMALIIIAALSWAAANIVMKQVGQVNMFRFIVYKSLIPPIPLLILSFSLEGQDRIVHALSHLTISGVATLFYLAIISTVLGFSAWGFLIRSYPAAKVAPFALLVPVFGMEFSALILGEEFGPLRLLGAICVIMGLAVILWSGMIKNWAIHGLKRS